MGIPLIPIIDAGMRILDKVIPDQKEREKAKLELFKQEQAGQLKELEVSLSAILTEASSDDPWTSRARPTFMYIIYIMILASIPMGVVFSFSPVTAAAITTGVKAWLEAIPQELYMLFGAGYLGYTHYRSADKKLLVK